MERLTKRDNFFDVLKNEDFYSYGERKDGDNAT